MTTTQRERPSEGGGGSALVGQVKLRSRNRRSHKGGERVQLRIVIDPGRSASKAIFWSENNEIIVTNQTTGGRRVNVT